MLVISRKEKERVLFPTLGIAVEILRVSGAVAKIGVEAPRDVRILRDELVDPEELAEMQEGVRRQRHELRNRVHSASLALHLLQKQLAAGLADAAEQTLSVALRSLSDLELSVAPGGQAEAKPAEPREAPSGDAPLALVVEDNANERELLAGYLELSGYRVATATDGLAAMRYLRTERPDLVLLDMQMPRMDGAKTISAIRRQPEFQDIKLIAVSGMDRSAANVALGPRGVDHWFSKPLKPTELMVTVEQALAGTGTSA